MRFLGFPFALCAWLAFSAPLNSQPQQQVLASLSGVVAATIPQTGALIRQIDDTGIAGSDGSALATWTAVIGSSFTGNATVRTGPTHGLNSLSVVEFNGSTDHLVSSQAGATIQTFTIGIVFKYLSVSGNQAMLNPDPVIVWVTGGNFNAGSGTGQDIAVADTNWHKLLVVFNGPSSTYSIDGGALTAFAGTLGTGKYADAAGNYEWIGAYNSSGSVAFPANVQVAAYYVWSVGLVSGEKTQWSSYITSHYGL